MIYEIVKKRPSDPAAYAAKWLQNYLSNFSFIQQKDLSRMLTLALNAVMTKCLLIILGLRRIKPKVRKGVEWVFPKRSLVISIKKILLSSDASQNLNKLKCLFLV